MTIPFDEGLGIHPQDDFFLDREVWDLSKTPDETRPLLLHYHPLVIYRFQVLKQADVVMALFLQGDRFTAEEKRADFEYYDPITTGDSTLSAVVQSIMAAEVGYHEDAWRYFLQGLYVDLMNLHDNTVDGMHIASAGGVWRSVVNGFAGMRDIGGSLSFDPRLPDAWSEIAFPLCWRGSRLRVAVRADVVEIVHEGDTDVEITIGGTAYDVAAGSTLTVELDGHGPRIDGFVGDKPLIGGTRADGTMITAGVPDPIPFEDHQELGPADVPLVDPPVPRRRLGQHRRPDHQDVGQVRHDLLPGVAAVGRGPHGAVARADVEAELLVAVVAHRVAHDRDVEVVGQALAQLLPRVAGVARPPDPRLAVRWVAALAAADREHEDRVRLVRVRRRSRSRSRWAGRPRCSPRSRRGRRSGRRRRGSGGRAARVVTGAASPCARTARTPGTAAPPAGTRPGCRGCAAPRTPRRRAVW